MIINIVTNIETMYLDLKEFLSKELESSILLILIGSLLASIFSPILAGYTESITFKALLYVFFSVS